MRRNHARTGTLRAPWTSQRWCAHFRANAAAADVVLTAAELALLVELVPPGAVAGERDPPELPAHVEL